MKILMDGKEIQAAGNKTVLEVARENGISIPSLCDHKQLTPFSGCRLCLVQIKGEKTYRTACTTTVKEGMEVKTKTPKLNRLRKKILELILTEHPHSCLICTEKKECDEYKSTIRKVGEVTGCVLCPNNGRCELQKVADEIKVAQVSFPSYYRGIECKRDDPFFDRDYNLCILCGRCVRICHEVRGLSIISFAQRGPETVVGTAFDKTLLESNCQFCGACVDVCPTGALTDRAARYSPLPEEKAMTVCPLCSIGCELEIHLNRGEVIQTRPSINGKVNRGQACVKGRFIVRDLISTPERISKPLLRKAKELEEVSWDQALDAVVQKLGKYKGSEVALIASAQSSVEDLYVFHKFANEAMDARCTIPTSFFSPLSVFGQWAQKKGLGPKLNFRMGDIASADTIFILDADVAAVYPVFWLEVFSALKNGARLIFASPSQFLFTRFASTWLNIKPGTESSLLNALSKLIIEDESPPEGSSLARDLAPIDVSEISESIGVDEDCLKKTTKALNDGKRIAFLFGFEFVQGPGREEKFSALWNLAQCVGAELFPLALENNDRGAFELERAFSRQYNSMEDLSQALSKNQVKALYLSGKAVLPENRDPEFLVVQDSYDNENVCKADVVLPTTTFAEEEGLFVNLEGRIQKTNKLIDPFGEAWPEWRIVSEIARRMGKSGFEFKKPSDVMKEIRTNIFSFCNASYAQLEKGKEIFIQEKLADKSEFVSIKQGKDSNSREKQYPLQLMIHYNLDYYKSLVLSKSMRSFGMFRNERWIGICPEDAEKLQVKEGEKVVVEYPGGRKEGIAHISSLLSPGMLAVSPIEPIVKENKLLSRLPVKIKRGKS